MYSSRNRGTNVFFNNYNSSQEQDLWEDLVIESIRIYGQDMIYLPRKLVEYDDIYGEDAQSEYSMALPIELYIKSIDGFEGDGVFLSKFGLQIQDQVTFTVAKRIFELEVARTANIPRPNEGDLIYFPLNKKLFQIQYVNYKPFFYQLGELQTYDLTCTLFEYGNEILDTGIEAIDELQKKYSFNALDFSILAQDNIEIVTENDDILVNEQYLSNDFQDSTEDNTEIQIEVEETDLHDWDESDPFSLGDSY